MSTHEEIVDRLNEELQGVLQQLKATKKILARDWAALSPRERSAYAREVKALEDRQKVILQEIEINTPL